MSDRFPKIARFLLAIALGGAATGRASAAQLTSGKLAVAGVEASSETVRIRLETPAGNGNTTDSCWCLGEDGGWSSCSCPKRPAPDEPPRFARSLPADLPLAPADPVAFDPWLAVLEPDERIGSAIRDDDGAIRFGIEFYAGEGSGGVGGFGKFDPVTHRVEIRRGGDLANFSTIALAADGDVTWLATRGQGEGVAAPGGLLRYEWIEGNLTTFAGSEDGPCGVLPSELAISGRRLYVATELGLSVLAIESGEWSHFVRDGERPPIRSTPCEPLLRRLVAEETESADTLVPYESYWGGSRSSAMKWHAAIRPRTMRKLLGARRAISWTDGELFALGSTMPSVGELGERVLRWRGFTADAMVPAISGYASTHPCDPDLRELLITLMTAGAGIDRYDLIRLLHPFAEEPTVVAFVLATFRDRDVIEHAPTLLGDRGPLLLGAIFEAVPGGDVLDALERSVGKILPPTGDAIDLGRASRVAGYYLFVTRPRSLAGYHTWKFQSERDHERIRRRWREELARSGRPPG